MLKKTTIVSGGRELEQSNIDDLVVLRATTSRPVWSGHKAAACFVQCFGVLSQSHLTMSKGMCALDYKYLLKNKKCLDFFAL